MKKREPEKVGNDIYGVKSNWKTDEKTGKTAESDFRHSSYYHKYFHGYTELRIEKPNGGYKVERYYTQPWLVQDVSSVNYIVYRCMYAALVLLSCLVFYQAMTADGYSGNRSVLVAAPEFLSALGLILLVAATVNYTFMHRQMTWYDHRSASGNLRKASLFAACCMGATALLVVVNIFLGVDSVLAELRLAGLSLVAALAALAIYLLERQMPYREEANTTVLPQGETHEIW